MARWMVRVVGGVVAAFTAVAAVLLVGLRTKSPTVVNRVRRFNKAVTNPRVLRTAGEPGASASVIRHIGRVSGRRYETPVGPFAVADAFVIALPYGSQVDWARNLMASGSAELVHEGRTLTLSEPEVLSVAEMIVDLPPSEQRMLRLFAVDECLRVRAALDRLATGVTARSRVSGRVGLGAGTPCPRSEAIG